MVFGLFKKKEPVKVTVKSTGETFMCNPDELLMKAAMRQKIAWPHSCKVGSCGSCRATIVEGEGNILQVHAIRLLYYTRKKWIVEW